MLGSLRTRWLLSAGRLVPTLLCVVTLVLLEASRVEGTPATEEAAPVAPTRLVILFIDSLATRDATQASKFPHLAALLPESLHGPVRACADALTVPCFTAMTTGVDRYSLFSLIRNFGGVDGAPSGSVLRTLQNAGHKVGFIGDPMFEHAAIGLDWTRFVDPPDDARIIDQGLSALESERLDVLVLHVREMDEAAHAEGPDSRVFADTVRKTDALIGEVRVRLRPQDNFVVLGDHGHLADGRHFAGLDVPTYAAFLGPRFARPMERPMAITDHAAIWAHVFGLSFGGAPWVDDYFAGRRVDVPTELPTLPTGAGIPRWAFVAALLLAGAVALPGRFFRRRGSSPWPVPLATLGLALVLAAFAVYWSEFRTLVSYKPRAFANAFAAATALVGGAVLYPALTRFVKKERGVTERALVAGLAGALLLALPTVYKYGGAYVALTALLGLTVAAGVQAFLERRHRTVALAVGFGLVLSTLWNPAVRNFSVQWFPFYSEVLRGRTVIAALVFGAVAVAFSAGPRREGRIAWIVLGIVGLAAGAFSRVLPPRLFFVPCAFAWPVLLAAFRSRSFEPVALCLGLAATAFFYDGDSVTLAAIGASFALFAAWPHLRPRATPIERGVTLLVLTWATFWVSMGARFSGISFQYFFRFLDKGANVEATWAVNAFVTTGKYLSVPLLGLLLAKRARPGYVRAALAAAWPLARVRLGLVLAFVAFFSRYSYAAGPFVTADVLSEAGIWGLILIVLGGLPITRTSARLSELGAPDQAPKRASTLVRAAS